MSKGRNIWLREEKFDWKFFISAYFNIKNFMNLNLSCLTIFQNSNAAILMSVLDILILPQNPSNRKWERNVLEDFFMTKQNLWFFFRKRANLQGKSRGVYFPTIPPSFFLFLSLIYIELFGIYPYLELLKIYTPEKKLVTYF